MGWKEWNATHAGHGEGNGDATGLVALQHLEDEVARAARHGPLAGLLGAHDDEALVVPVRGVGAVALEAGDLCKAKRSKHV